MRKKLVSAALVLTMAFAACGAVRAAEDQDAAADWELKSHGRFTYQDGEDEVLIDSLDFYKLEERINLVKQDVAKQLGRIHTYFTTGEGVSVKTREDVRVTHTEPSDGHAVDPLSIDFNTLLEGVAASQSVPSDVTAYGYPEGTILYLNADGVLTSDGTEKGAEPVTIDKAEAQNISAGMAAWVDGRLVLGTGGDNKAHREEGYKKGLEDAAPGAGAKQFVDLVSEGYSYTVPEDVTGGFIWIGSKNKVPWASISGAATVMPFSVSCNHGESQSSHYHLMAGCYYYPKIKAGSSISVESSCRFAYFIYYK